MFYRFLLNTQAFEHCKKHMAKKTQPHKSPEAETRTVNSTAIQNLKKNAGEFLQ